MSWNAKQILRLSVSVLLTLIIVIVLAIITFYRGSLAGYRYYQPVPLFQISNQYLTENTINATITNTELNPVTLSAWYTITDSQTNTVIHTAEREILPIILSQQASFVSFELPADYLPLNENYRIELKVAEFIPYVDARREEFDHMVFGDRADDAPVTLNQINMTSIEAGRYNVQLEINIDNQETHSQDFRYSFTINRANGSNNRILLQDTVFESQFFYLTVDARQAVSDNSEFALALERGHYVVSLWVQKLADNGIYVHFWQTNFPEPIELDNEE